MSSDPQNRDASMPEQTPVGDGVGLAPGTKIGKYEVVRRMAIGGQAILYVCRDPLLDRTVAVKQISTQLAEDPKFIERFRAEARILARLGAEQPAIITVHDLIEDEKGLFIVMEHVEGPTLERVLADNAGPVEAKAVLQLLWRLASALYDVHTAGIVHRDLKPSNIIVTEGLHPKIVDFGVAASVTGQTSMKLGTTKYMAPELYAEGPVDGRADIYSLGFLTYEMLLGREKFNEIFQDVIRDRHSEALRWMKWHGNESVEAPELAEIAPTVPQGLSDIVMRMIAKDRDDRFESMEQLGRSIKQAFSPRAKAASKSARDEADLARRGRRAKSSRGAGAGAGRAGQGIDEADELVVAPEQPAPTAPLPSGGISLKTKIILGSVLFLIAVGLVVGLVVRSHLQTQETQQEVSKAFAAAESYYTTALQDTQRAQGRLEGPVEAFLNTNIQRYANAAEAYENVRVGYKGTPEAAKAAVLRHVAESRKLILQAHSHADDRTRAFTLLDESGKKQDTAREVLDAVQRQREELLQWTRDQERELNDLRSYRTYCKDFIRQLESVRAALGEKQFDEGLNRLRMIRELKLTYWQRDLVDRLETAAQRTRLTAELESYIRLGDTRMEEKQFDAAANAYQQARSIARSEQAQQYLDGEYLQEKLSDLETKIQAVGSRSTLFEKLAKVDEARKAGDKVAELAALIDVERIASAPERQMRIKRLRAEIFLERAKAVIEANPSEAKDLLEKSLAQMELREARLLLNQIDKNQSYTQLINQARSAYLAENWSEALAKYIEAGRVSPDKLPEIRPKIVEINFKMQLAKADHLRSEGKLREAVRAYERARDIDRTKAQIIENRIAQVRRTMQVQELLSAGDKAMEEGKYPEARNYWKQATEILREETPEISSRIRQSWYRQWLNLGKGEFEASRYRSALGYLNRAKEYGTSDELERLLAETRKRLSESGDEES